MKRYWMAFLLLVMSLLSLPLSATAGLSPDRVWEDIPTGIRSALSSGREPWISPEIFRLSRLDESSLAAVLTGSRTGGSPARSTQSLPQLTLPTPDGRFVTVIFEEKPVMAPDLAARYPEIRTFTGHLAEDPSVTVAFDWTPAGFHAQVLSAEGAWYIDPYIPGESYASYYKRDYRPEKRFTDYPSIQSEGRVPLGGRTPLETIPFKSDRIRTYRLALGCTAEYARFQCGGVCTDKTKPMAAINTTVNRVNQIYRREMAIEFVLVGSNDRLVFLDPLTQPFTNGHTGRLLEQSQTVIDREIGNDHYDVGHVFSTSDGGLSLLGGVCQPGKKAMAITGLEQPKGDAYDVDFVCHEMGHQFSADHTYNGKLGLCSADQFAPHTAYEPGSGATIMSYGGQCDDDSLQFFGEVIFHSGNFDQIQAYVAGQGNCYSLSGANQAPVVQAGPDVTIPRGTPFTLTGVATDPDGDPLTYLWEPFDRSGIQASLSEPDDGRMPLFRLFRPTGNPARTFPSLETLALGGADKTEKLPQMARTMHFRLVARDGKGGVAYGTRRVTVDAGTGPLRLTVPAGGASVPPGSLSVAWDVAGTVSLPGASTVDILLSTDGGYSFNPAPLLSGVANNGAATVNLPDVGTERARLLIKASDNVFFAVSPGNFTITGNGGALSVTPPAGLVVSGNEGGPFVNPGVTYMLKNTGKASMDWTASKGVTWLTVSPSSGTLEAGGEASVTVTINETAAAALKRDHYQDTVVFANTTNGAGTTSRPVMLAVGQMFKEGLIVLEADGLDAWGFVGGPFSPSVKAFTIRNEGTSDASWTAAKTADWITLSSTGGTIAPGGSETVLATLAGVTEMEAGSRIGTVTFYRTLEKGSELVATRTMTLAVATLDDEGTLVVTPSEGLASTGYSGGPFAPAGKAFTLRNVGMTDLAWTASRTTEWVTVAPAGGTLKKGESVWVSMGINSAAASLAAGGYTDTLVFTNTTNGKGNTTRPASLSIATGPGGLSVSPASVFTFSGPRGGPFAPAAGAPCTLTNTGGAPLDWIIYFQESWLDASPFQGTLAPGASTQVTMKINDMARALLAGAYRNTIYVMNKTNRVGNTALESQITVAENPASGPLTVSPTAGVTVAGSKGGPFTPATFDFVLRNTGNSPIDWEYLGDASWIDVPDPAKGQLAAGSERKFSVAVNDTANLLSPNNYRSGLYFNDKTNKMIVGRFIDMKVKAVGDITGDGAVDLADVVTSVQVKAGQATPNVRKDYVAAGADVNGDDRVGHQETVYTMQAVAGVRQTPAPYFILKSGAFRDEQPIPARFMAHGLSPALSWSHAPTGTQSFVLIVEDPGEIPSHGAVMNYWIVYDIPASVSALGEGAGAKRGEDGKNQLPPGAKHGTTSWEKDNIYYHGLEPSSRTGPHRFIFRLYALSVASLNLLEGAKQDQIEAAMSGKILGICELAGTLSRP